ncbi:hypothetical protein OROMI_017819 [Orobanche minor]
MEKKTALILFSTLLLCILAPSSAKRPTKPLFLVNHNTNRSNFNAIDLSDRTNVVYSQKGLKENDLIKSLPGQPKVNFKQYSGYVTVNQTQGRALFYYLAEADQDSANNTLPLLLWLNGGPGCSSFGYGGMEELGPFRVHSDGKTLYKNDFAWNKAANVLFLESPAGVGFSYSNTTKDVETGGDERTASDNFVFLLNWFKRFPEHSTREFYISGQSYAGHYVPQLAQTILHYNQMAKQDFINLKGIIIGNAWINDETDGKGVYEYFASHALVPDYVANEVLNYCDFTPNSTEQSDKCKEVSSEAYKDIGKIDTYNIYAPLCSNSSLTNKPKETSATSFDPCNDHYVYAYLNMPEVQNALHAKITKIPYNWRFCNDVVFNNWQDSPSTVLPLLREIMTRGLRVWLYSGDTDGNVPVTSTQRTIEIMALPIKISWYPWYHFQEVGGYTTVYEGDLTFTTIRGSGHDVPRYQPVRALSLIMHFLSGTELSNSPNLSRK